LPCSVASYETHFSLFLQFFAIWGEGPVMPHQTSWLERMRRNQNLSS